jgi:hypothetical protein
MPGPSRRKPVTTRRSMITGLILGSSCVVHMPLVFDTVVTILLMQITLT